MMNTPDLECSGCGDPVSVTVARIAEEPEFASSLDEVHYLCPVCVIQARNTSMQAQLLRSANAR